MAAQQEKRRQGPREARVYWGLVGAFLALASLVFAVQPALLQSLRYFTFDTYQRLFPAPALPDSPVVIVAIDEPALATLGQWPWPRSTMAQLTERLGEAGAAAIVFDVMFAEPDRTSPEQMLRWLPEQRSRQINRVIARWPTHDGQFAETLARYPTVMAAVLHNEPTEEVFPQKSGFAMAGDDPAGFLAAFPGYSGSIPSLTAPAQGVGFINWLPDRDQVIRRVPLLAQQNGAVAPSLALETLRVAQGASTYIVRSSNAHGATAFGQHTGVNEVRVGGATIPTDAGSDIWIHFRRSDAARYISAADVVNGQADAAAFTGRIVLIGATAPGLLDLRATPLDSSIPGVEVHQQIIEQVVAGHYLHRPDFAPGIEWLVAVLAVLLIAFVALRASAGVSAGLGLGLTLVILVAGAVLFNTSGYLFDPVFPAICAFVFAASSATYLYRRAEMQRAEIRRAFSQYVSPTIVRELTANPERLKLGGEVRDLTLMFCDIRNFTTIAEGLSAEELTAFINSFLTPLSDIIIESGGTIDKYMGDAILAFWNAPMDDPEHALNACTVAMLMIEKMRELNVGWRAEAEAAGRNFTDVSIGIGINSGECCVGNLGSDRHFDYSAIGDTVNITSRLEGLTKEYGIALLIGEETAKRATGPSFVEIDLVRLKGRTTPSRVFTLLEPGETLAPSHEEFLKAYRLGDWAKAGLLLEAAEKSPLSKVYAVYKARLSAHEKTPPQNWDGVFEPDRK